VASTISSARPVGDLFRAIFIAAIKHTSSNGFELCLYPRHVGALIDIRASSVQLLPAFDKWPTFPCLVGDCWKE
jgi:hypothetical protein